MVSTSLEWGRQIVKGIVACANEVGPWHIWANPSQVDSLTHFPEGWKGDGIIARVYTEKLAQEIKQSGIPTVNVADTPWPGFGAPCVRTDDRAGAQLAAQHFLERGFRKFAFVGQLYRPVPAWYGRAFQAVLSAHGMSCATFAIAPDERALAAKLSAWLLKLTKPVAVLACGNQSARMVVDYCLDSGISVPHDVAVLSTSDDELLAHACFPALSGVLAPTEQIGYHAAKLLHRLMQGKKVPAETEYLPPLRVVERLSTDTLAVDDPKLAKVVAFMREHAFEAISMDDVLRAVPMARRSLERQFQQTFARSPLEEIRRIRIDRARRLLAETDLPMQDIAERCGYATYNYLTNVFKATTGMSPRNYRKQIRS